MSEVRMGYCFQNSYPEDFIETWIEVHELKEFLKTKTDPEELDYIEEEIANVPGG